jgi:hypothetical protein
VRSKQPHRAEVQGAVGQQVEDGRNATTRAGRFDSGVGSVLGEPERSRAVAEERAEALAEVESSGIELGQVSDELDGGLPLPRGENDDAAEQIRVGQPGRNGEPSVLHLAPFHHRAPSRASSGVESDCPRDRCHSRSGRAASRTGPVAVKPSKNVARDGIVAPVEMSPGAGAVGAAEDVDNADDADDAAPPCRAGSVPARMADRLSSERP